MKRFHVVPAVLWCVLALGCGSSNGREPGRVYRITDQRVSTSPVTPDAPDSPAVAPVPEEAPYVFTPRSHAPRYRTPERFPVSLASLPRLKTRLKECFPRERRRNPIPIAQPRPKSKSPSKKGAGSSRTKRRAGRRAGSGKPSQARDNAGDPLGGLTGVGAGEGGARKEKQPPSREDRKPVTRPKDAPQPPTEAAPPAATGDAPTPSMDEAVQYSSSMEMDADYEDYSGDEEAAEATPEEAIEMPPRPLFSEGPRRIATGEPTSPTVVEPEPAVDPYDKYDDWGSAIYLSNDDTMSLSSAQRVIYAIDHFLPLPAEHIRPHELLNYFSFDTAPVQDGYDFSVRGEIAPDPREGDIYSLGLAVKGRPVDKAARRNAAITLVIDRSGSMRDEGRMTYLKRGLLRMINELKAGDMVHIVLFDHELCVPAENFVVGRDNLSRLKEVINALKPKGATDLHRGLSKGYDIADRSYQPGYSNRVLMITDALTNTGVTDETMISMISKYYDTRRIRLSGVGVGREFNDALLDRLTERGKGAYVFLGSEMEVDAVFGPRFISLIETTALDVHFRLHLPPSLRMNVFYGEESSTVKADVQEIHYFANTSQLFLSDLMARGGALRPRDGVMLTIEYEDPETGEALQEEYAFSLEALSRSQRNVKKARVIMTWIDLLAEMAARPVPRFGSVAGSWQDSGGWQRCEEGRAELDRLASDVGDDPEIRRVNELWDKYCARYERPRHPVRRKIEVPGDAWPGASSQGR